MKLTNNVMVQEPFGWVSSVCCCFCVVCLSASPSSFFPALSCHISTDKGNGRRTDKKKCKKNVYPVMEVGEGRRGSCKERIPTGQVKDKERSTNVSVMDV